MKMNASEENFLNDRSRPRNAARNGFTAVELLAIISVLLVLISVLVPALGRTRSTGQAVQCLSNTRRLAVTWQMYAQDNNDRLVNVFHGSDAKGGAFDPSLGPGWAEGWLDWTLASDNTNEAFLVSAKYSKFAAYLSNPDVFQCPSDAFVSGPQQARGWIRRSRSYSMNITVGDGNALAGPWDLLYRQAKKLSDMSYPSPAQTWLFLEEHPDSMNDPAFFSPHVDTWVDFPATYHNGATAFAFADAHVELHPWTASLRARRYAEVHCGGDFKWAVGANDADIHWMSFHSQRLSQNSY